MQVVALVIAGSAANWFRPDPYLHLLLWMSKSSPAPIDHQTDCNYFFGSRGHTRLSSMSLVSLASSAFIVKEEIGKVFPMKTFPGTLHAS
tara:strand:+ start:840 stop:1109 length:270 start_codon:yes stop_codon:yes gene_type:complete